MGDIVLWTIYEFLLWITQHKITPINTRFTQFGKIILHFFLFAEFFFGKTYNQVVFVYMFSWATKSSNNGSTYEEIVDCPMACGTLAHMVGWAFGALFRVGSLHCSIAVSCGYLWGFFIALNRLGSFVVWSFRACKVCVYNLRRLLSIYWNIWL